MKPVLLSIIFVLATVFTGFSPSIARASTPVDAQQDDAAARLKTRKRLELLLEKVGPSIDVTFKQSKNQPFNYVGSLKRGLVNAELLEIVVSVTSKDTIGLRVYPHYKGGYINVDKARDRVTLMRTLLRLSDRAFLFWGIDETGDVFTGYTFTLESGFPDEAITVVLRSIANSDTFVGDLRPSLDPLPRRTP